MKNINLFNIEDYKKIFYLIILFIFIFILYSHYSTDLVFYHSDYNTIIGNITYYLNNSKWNTDSWVTYTYQLFPQKITAYTIVILDFFFGNYENFNSRNWIGLIFRIYSVLAAIGTIIYSNRILRYYFKESFYLFFLFLTSYIFYFCFTEIRNDGFYVFFVVIITFKGLVYYENPNIKNIFLLSLLFSLSLCTRINSISLIIPILILGIICLKENKIDIKKFLYHSFIFLSVLIFFYLLVNFRSFDFYINYYHAHPLFNDYSGLNFFQSFSGTKQLSIFWYSDYWATSGVGILIIILSSIGAYLFIKKNYKSKYIIIYLFSVPSSIILMIGFHQVAADRYSFGLIPFIFLFASFALVELNRKKNIFNFYLNIFICGFLVLKICLWFFTFTTPSTRENAINWVYKNIPEGSGIFFYNMADWNSKALENLNKKYSIWQYVSPYLNLKDVKDLSKLNYNYIIHGENGYQFYYPEIQPHLIENKYSYEMKFQFENFYSSLIKKSNLIKTFHNKIFESGIFHSKGYDTSNYIKDVYQPIIFISKIRQEYDDSNFFIFDANSLSKDFYTLKNVNGVNYVKLKKNSSNFYEYKGPYENLPKGSYKILVSLKKLDDIKSEVSIKIMNLNKREISFEKVNMNKKKYIYERKIDVNNIGKNQIEISLSTLSDKVLINEILIKKLNIISE